MKNQTLDYAGRELPLPLSRGWLIWQIGPDIAAIAIIAVDILLARIVDTGNWQGFAISIVGLLTSFVHALCLVAQFVIILLWLFKCRTPRQPNPMLCIAWRSVVFVGLFFCVDWFLPHIHG